MEEVELQDTIRHRLVQSRVIVEDMLADQEFIDRLEGLAVTCLEKVSAGGKIMFMGNGGSAADSQHLATELTSRFLLERDAIAAIALTTDTSALTAIANDYSFDRVFVRQIEALASPNDVVIGISTSGNSENILAGVKAASAIGCHTVAFTGASGGKLAPLVDTAMQVHRDVTPIIQQAHITIGQILCELIEKAIAEKSSS